MIHLFADPTADALAGGSGWVGAGLLGLVLAWLLLVHLPAKDKLLLDVLKQFRDEIAAERKVGEERDTKICRAIADLAPTFAEVVRKILDGIRFRNQDAREAG